jgi:hypothetical protein
MSKLNAIALNSVLYEQLSPAQCRMFVLQHLACDCARRLCLLVSVHIALSLAYEQAPPAQSKMNTIALNSVLYEQACACSMYDVAASIVLHSRM